MRNLIVLLLLVLAAPAHAWSEGGHHLVSLIAYDLLDESDREQLYALLQQHPRFEEDFTPDPKVNDGLRYQVGLAGYWPDIARGQPEYNRPTWHYQLGSTLVLGDESAVNVPATPGPPPISATLDTRELHIAQALELCRRAMADPSRLAADRALALCWIAHLVGDSHQPCHAGSLYADNVFPDGDRGANSIKLTNGRNLHALWDGLLGRRFDEGDVKRRYVELTTNPELVELARHAENDLRPLRWLEESRTYSKNYTYTREVLGPIEAAVEGKAEELPTLTLSQDYLKTAGGIAGLRVMQAGYRLVGVWADCL